jgi:hypothetical protein
MTISCDFDPARVYVKKSVRARKEYRCCECNGVIRVGEGHEVVRGCWDGDWSCFRTCPDCVFLRCELSREYGEGCGWLHGGMLEELGNCVENARFNDGARRFVVMFNATSVLRGGSIVSFGGI